MPVRIRRLATRLLPGLILLAAAPAEAVEVQFEGFYRARARLYDSLSLDRDLATNEGTALYAQHRLWLRPRFLLSENVSLHTEVLGLQNAYWGGEPQPWEDPVLGEQPLAFTDDVATAATPEDDTAAVRPPDITLWRAWGQIDSAYGRFAFGRMPLHWGLGMWQNDGLGWNAEFGDTADRVQWEHEVSDVWVRLAIDTIAEQLVNDGDDTVAYSGVVAYRAENVTAGFQARYRRTGSPRLNLFTIDGAAEAELGRLTARLEGIGQFGSGDLTEELNDVSITTYGGVVDLAYDADLLGIGLEGGIASGDASPNDQRITTFTFDPDYNVGIILFEQPLPTLAAAAEAEERDFNEAVSGGAVSNALYVRPRLSRSIVDGLKVEASLLGARVLRAPAEDRRSYGFEIDAGLRWTPYPDVELGGTFGVFLPGTYYRNLETDLGAEFSDPVFGAQIISRIRF